jgi:hypothetical protein
VRANGVLKTLWYLLVNFLPEHVEKEGSSP